MYLWTGGRIFHLRDTSAMDKEIEMGADLLVLRFSSRRSSWISIQMTRCVGSRVHQTPEDILRPFLPLYRCLDH